MALEGSLHDMSLTDLFQIFRTGSKSGVLILSGGPDRGIMYINRGYLIDALLVRNIERQLIATAEEAVIQLLQWEEGMFVFRHDVSVAERPVRIAHDVEWLIIETIRRREHPLQLLPHQTITLDARLELASMPHSTENGVNLTLDQWRMLSQIAISESLREICDRIGLTPEMGIRVASDLVAIGLIEVVPPPKPPAAIKPASSTRQHLSKVLMTQPLMPNMHTEATNVPDHASAQVGGRGLLGAIMRRIRGL